MELHKQIKKYRLKMNLSQEELADKIYVTRQTISNWENDKNYPDIHSLLLLSSTFQISLDQLIKGDVSIMKEEIQNVDLKQFNRDSIMMTILMGIIIISVVPLAFFLRFYGFLITGILSIITMYYAIRIEKFKKENDIQTYKEIIAFTEGKKLDELEKTREIKKRPYQKLGLALLSGLIALIGCILSAFLIWLFKSLLF